MLRTRLGLSFVLLLAGISLRAQTDPSQTNSSPADQKTQDAAQTATPTPVSINGAYPAVAFPEKDHGDRYDFTVYGHGFSVDDPKKDDVWIAGLGSIIDANGRFASQDKCAPAPETTLDSAIRTCLWVDSPTELHVVGYKPPPDHGRVMIEAVVNGDHYSDKDALVLSRVTRAGAKGWTCLVFLMLALVLFLMISKGLKGKTINGGPIRPLEALLFDSQTDTYSLSKFQLFAFCAVFLYAYLYCFICSWLVQGNFALPDVPLQFAGLLGMSAGTTVVAAGITQSVGSKGAGASGPSFSDFVSQGGLVVPERFFCFAWTLLACVGFLVLMISQDPATASQFPTIPDGLLYVMGVSSAGYLGGKASRGPGPVIRNIAYDAASRLVVVQGENLSYEADLFIDNQKLPIVINPPAGGGVAGANASGLITYTVQVPPASDRTLCSELRVTLDPSFTLPALAPPITQHTLRLVNGDGQFAEAMF